MIEIGKLTKHDLLLMLSTPLAEQKLTGSH